MNYIGIDLGGTNIKGALVSAEGEILKEHSIPTRVDLGPEAVAGRIGQVIDRRMQLFDVYIIRILTDCYQISIFPQTVLNQFQDRNFIVNYK